MEKIALSKNERERRKERCRGLLKALAIKHTSLSRDMERVWRSAARSLQKAVLKDDDMEVQAILLRLQIQATDIYRAGLVFSVDMAYDYLESQEDYEDSGDDQDKKSIAFWLPAILLYVANLRNEISWYRGQDYPKSEFMGFLNNPLAWLMARDIPTAKFRSAVNVGQGRRYQVRKDFTKNILYSMTTALYEALREGYQKRQVVAYVGFRNGDYPCDLCDEYEGMVMPIEEMVYPLHVNCICGWYELYSDEITSI